MQERSTFFDVMIGMVILVVASLVMSLALDGRRNATVAKKASREAEYVAAEEIRTLKEQIRERESKFARIGPQRVRVAGNIDPLRASIAVSTTRIRELKGRQAALEAAIPQVVVDFRKYRVDHRNQVWARAAGETIPALTTRNGREYTNVTILRVLPTGIEIGHEYGRARIPSTNLGPEWEARFQWNQAAELSMN